MLDESTGSHWSDLDAAGRKASAISGGLAWDGPSAKAAVPSTLAYPPLVRVTSAPATPSVVKDYSQVTVAQFSGQIGTSPVSGPLGVGSTQWGCTGSGPLAALDGQIAILDRGGPDPGCGLHLRGEGPERPGRRGHRPADRQQRHRSHHSVGDRARHHHPRPLHDPDRRAGAEGRGGRRHRERPDRPGPEPGLPGRGRVPAAAPVRAEHAAAGLVGLALGHLGLPQPPDGARHQRGPAPHARPDPPAPPGHRVVRGGPGHHWQRALHAGLGRERHLHLHGDQSGARRGHRGHGHQRALGPHLRLQLGCLHHGLPLRAGRSPPGRRRPSPPPSRRARGTAPRRRPPSPPSQTSTPRTTRRS